MELVSELNAHVLQGFHTKWAKYWLTTNEASDLEIIYQREAHNSSPSTDEIILLRCIWWGRKRKVITFFVAIVVRMTACCVRLSQPFRATLHLRFSESVDTAMEGASPAKTYQTWAWTLMALRTIPPSPRGGTGGGLFTPTDLWNLYHHITPRHLKSATLGVGDGAFTGII